MARNFKLKNMKQFMGNLNDEIRQLRGRTHKGLIEAAIILQREAEPETPFDIGNLRASWFIVSYKTGEESDQPSFKGQDAGSMAGHHQNVVRASESLAKQFASEKRPVLVFGYSANYAPFVHEMVGADFGKSGGKRAKNAQARWLFAAMQRSKTKMLQAIKREASF